MSGADFTLEGRGWLPIEGAPRNGVSVLLLYPSGRVEIGRWEHTVRTVNDEVKHEHAGWTTSRPSLFGRSEPILYAHIPELPERDADGFFSEARHA